ncbi:MAG: hypothetical protein JNK76_07180 [Planctomycetales bacterium]|nr:hypothetical protein [Planctomycetales bacterium]
MAERRSLIDGVKPQTPAVDPQVEEAFVRGAKLPGGGAEPVPPSATTAVIPRSPLSTRIRSDYAKALKHASLDRQLKAIEPNTISDILEQALEPWLKTNGYLP